jgi:hypothetical protein
MAFELDLSAALVSAVTTLGYEEPIPQVGAR